MRHRKPDDWDEDTGGGDPQVQPDAGAAHLLPLPGSLKAREQGCRCPVLPNRIPDLDALIAPDCPLHAGESPP